MISSIWRSALGSTFEANESDATAFPFSSDYIEVSHVRICSLLQSVGGCWRAPYIMISNVVASIEVMSRNDHNHMRVGLMHSISATFGCYLLIAFCSTHLIITHADRDDSLDRLSSRELFLIQCALGHWLKYL